MATYFTPSVSQIHDWQFMGATNNSGVSGGLLDFLGYSENDAISLVNYDFPTFSEFDLAFEKGNLPYKGGALIGYRHTVDLSGFDAFVLSVSNVNENPWDYALYVANVDGNMLTKYYMGLGSVSLTPSEGYLVLPNGSSAVLSLDLATVSGMGIDLTKAYIGFAVGAALPIADSDYMSETQIAPVPEPATMLLFGTGLIGLAFVGRKKLIKRG